MHRASTRQAELDARVLRERRIARRLLNEPETYTAMAERPARALLGGTVASLVIALVVAVVAAAGSARSARGGDERARPSSAGTSSTVPSATAATTVADGGVLPTAVSVSQAAPACRARAAEIEVIPLFAQGGGLRRVELDGLDPGCVGLQVRVSVRAQDGAELDSRAFVLSRAGSTSVGSWPRDPPLRRAEIGEVVVEIL